MFTISPGAKIYVVNGDEQTEIGTTTEPIELKSIDEPTEPVELPSLEITMEAQIDRKAWGRLAGHLLYWCRRN